MASVRGKLQVQPEFAASIEAARWAVLRVLGEPTPDPEPGRRKLDAASAWRRKCFIYTAVVGLNVPGQQAAIAAGVWKPWASQLLREIEDMRDDRKIDALMEALRVVAVMRRYGDTRDAA